MGLDGLLAQRGVGAGGLDDGDLDEVLAGGAGPLAQRLLLDLDVSSGHPDDGLLGLADGGGLVGGGDYFLVDSGGPLVALLGVSGHGVLVGHVNSLVGNVLLLNHGPRAASFLELRLGDVGGNRNSGRDIHALADGAGDVLSLGGLENIRDISTCKLGLQI